MSRRIAIGPPMLCVILRAYGRPHPVAGGTVRVGCAHAVELISSRTCVPLMACRPSAIFDRVEVEIALVSDHARLAVACGRRPSLACRDNGNMDPKPLRMADGHVCYFDHNPETRLHTITVTTAEGEVCSRMTMTTDDVRRFAHTMTGALDSLAAGTDEPGIVVTEDTIVVVEVKGRGTEEGND